MGELDAGFFRRDAVTVAEDLVGAELVAGGCRGRIVECEGYLGDDDPASHAHGGRTDRNAPMFGPPGRAYVYRCYGVHRMLNVTTDVEGTPGAVLLRAVEPLAGEGAMRERRGVDDPTELTSGPGKLAEAFDVGLSDDGESLLDGTLRIEPTATRPAVVEARRVGVSGGEELSYRFYDPDAACVSVVP